MLGSRRLLFLERSLRAKPFDALCYAHLATGYIDSVVGLAVAVVVAAAVDIDVIVRKKTELWQRHSTEHRPNATEKVIRCDRIN